MRLGLSVDHLRRARDTRRRLACRAVRRRREHVARALLGARQPIRHQARRRPQARGHPVVGPKRHVLSAADGLDGRESRRTVQDLARPDRRVRAAVAASLAEGARAGSVRPGDVRRQGEGKEGRRGVPRRRASASQRQD